MLALGLFSTLGQAQQYLQNVPDMSLKRFAAWLRTLSKSIDNKAKAEGPATMEANQLQSIYEILITLQRKRGEYIQSVQYLVQAKEQHLPQETARVRSNAVAQNASELYRELNVLDNAVTPLQLKIDTEHPNVVHFKYYQQQQEQSVKQMKEPAMVGTFTTKDLRKIEHDAQANGEVLKQAIDEFSQTINALHKSGGA